MIIAGSDVSGNTRGGGQKRYIAIVIGTEERINKIHKDIGIKEIHMSELTPNQREKVYRKLNFNRSDIVAWCLDVEKQNIVHGIFKHTRLFPKKTNKGFIEKKFDHHLLQAIRSRIENFTYTRNGGLRDLTVQCDSDMFHTVKYWGMHDQHKGKAFELADAVAWFNEKNRKIKHCIQLDLKKGIKDEMESEFIR